MNPRAKKKAGSMTGRILLVLGLIAIFAPMFHVSNYDSLMDPWWNLTNTKVKLSERMSESFMSIGGFRQEFPMYADLHASELATRLHARYFNEMSQDKYAAIFIGTGYAEQERGAGDLARDPLELRDWPYDYKDEDPRVLALAQSFAMEQGLYGLRYEETSVPYWCFALLGLLLVAAGMKKVFRQKT